MWRSLRAGSQSARQRPAKPLLAGSTPALRGLRKVGRDGRMRRFAKPLVPLKGTRWFKSSTFRHALVTQRKSACPTSRKPVVQIHPGAPNRFGRRLQADSRCDGLAGEGHVKRWPMRGCCFGVSDSDRPKKNQLTRDWRYGNMGSYDRRNFKNRGRRRGHRFSDELCWV